MEPKDSNIFFFAFGPLKTSITQGSYGVHVTNALNLEKMAPLRTRLLGSLQVATNISSVVLHHAMG
jgi:hypothetical protein